MSLLINLKKNGGISMKSFTALILACIMLLTLVACGDTGTSQSADTGTSGTSSSSSGTETQPAAEGGARDSLKIAMDGEVPSLDAHLSPAILSRFVTRYIFEGLLEFDSNYEPQLQLAESMEHNDDCTEWTFAIRKGVKFHNGEEMTVEDVVASLNRWKALSAAAASVISDEEAFEAVDDSTVRIKLQNPTFLFPYYMADTAQFAAIMPTSVVSDADADTGVKEIIGTGSMQLDEFRTSLYINLIRFDDYTPPNKPRDGFSGDKTAAVSEMRFDFVTDSATRIANGLSGDYDIIEKIDMDSLEQFEGQDDVQLLKGMTVTNLLVINKKEGIGTDINFRKAISYAVNVNEVSMAQYSAQEFVEITSSYMPSTFPLWYTDVADDLFNQQDLDKAKGFLAQSTYSGEEVNLVANSDNPANYGGALVISEQLKKIGINVNIIATDYATWLSNLGNTSLMDMFVTDLAPCAIPNTLRFISPVRTGFTNIPELQDILADMNKATEIEEAQELWVQGQRLAEENAIVVVLGHNYNVNAAKSNVVGYETLSGVCLWDTYATE